MAVDTESSVTGEKVACNGKKQDDDDEEEEEEQESLGDPSRLMIQGGTVVNDDIILEGTDVLIEDGVIR